MAYGSESALFKIPKPDSGDTSSSSEEGYRSDIPEWVMENMLRGLAGDDTDATIAQGFTVSAGAGLSVNVSAGRGFVDGLCIYASGTTNKSGLTPSTTNYIYLKKTGTTKRDRSFTVEASLSGGGMTDAILIASATTDASSVTGVDNDPSGRAPRIPQTWGGVPQLRVVATSGGDYTDPETAIEACNAGDWVLICPGTYTLTSTITVPADDIRIEGISRDGVVLDNTTGSTQTVLDLNEKDGLCLRGFTIQTAAGNDGYAIDASGCTDLRVEDVKIDSTALSRGISAIGSSPARIFVGNCYFTGSFSGWVIVTDAPRFTAFANLIDSSGAAQAINVRHDDGLLLGNTIVRSQASYSAFAIKVQDADRTRIIGNNIRATNSPGAWTAIDLLANADGTNKDAMIANNVLESVGDTGTGIKLETSASQYQDETIIAANTVLDFATGVNLADTRVRETLVHGNKVATCTSGVSDSGTNTNQQDQD